MLSVLAGCGQAALASLPGGYKIWVMNSKEIYLSAQDNELVVGPALRKIGVTEHYIVTFSDKAGAEYIGNLKTSNYSLVNVQDGTITTDLSESDAKSALQKKGDAFPAMLDFNSYPLVTQ